MDSMVGYKNDKYLYFGRTAALLDDVVNFVPSRISAWLMIIACLFLGNDFSARDAIRIHKRDCRKHASPNSAQTESTAAGALGIQLAGDAVYFGDGEQFVNETAGGALIDVIYYPGIDTFRGRNSLQLTITNYRRSRSV